MVFKPSKLRARHRKCSSSDSESPIVFSESSNESLPVLKQQIQVNNKAESPKHFSHDVFKSPMKCDSPKLEVNKKKIVRTYGTKFVFWESVASSTPINVRPPNLKLTPFSPIDSIPSPSESPLEEQGQENSNDWCTYMTEEQKTLNQRPSSLIPESPQNKTLTAAVNTFPGGNLSSEAIENGPSVKAVKEDVPELIDSRNIGSGKKQPIVNIRSHEELVSNNSRPQIIKNTTASKDGHGSMSQADSKTHKKKKETMKKRIVNRNLKIAENTVYDKRITRQSKIPPELVVQNIVGSDTEDVVNVKEKEIAGREKINFSSCKISTRKSVHFIEEGQSKDDVNVKETEITTKGIEKKQRSLEQLRKSLTESAAVRIASEREEKEANLVSASPLKKMKPVVNMSKEIINFSKEITAEKESGLNQQSAEEDDSGLRKSKRRRLAPLQYWKGERVQYEPVDHPECKIMYKIVGVVRPRVQETRQENGHNAPDDKLENKYKHMRQTHRKKMDHYKEDILSLSRSNSSAVDVREKIPLRLNSVTKDIECVAHFSKTAFEPFVPHSGRRVKGLQYQPCLSINGLTNSILKIAVGTSLQNDINDDIDMLLFVARGRVDITVNEHVAHMRPGSSVIIPRGVPYTIENVGSSETLLSCVKKM